MHEVLEKQPGNIFNSGNQEVIVENRIEALKALASLLLREVESLGYEPKNRQAKEKINLSDELEKFEVNLIRDALIRAKGHQRQAAKLLGTKVTTLNAKIKRYGIEPIKLFGKN